MAEAKKDLTDAEKSVVRQALVLYRTALIRRRGTEIPGSDIHKLRGKEIDESDMLIQRFS